MKILDYYQTRLVSLKLKAKLRKSAVTGEAWEQTWKDIDLRMAENQKKITYA